MDYCLLLGREPLLSIAEAESVYRKPLRVIQSRIGIFTADEAKKEFSSLGGSIKLGKIIATVPASEWKQNPHYILSDKGFISQIHEDASSISFAMSQIGAPLLQGKREMKQVALAWKKELKKHFSHVRFVESRDAVTSSVTVRRNRLLRGCDLWIIADGENVLLAKTVAVQDYQEFARQDYDRPASDALAGMLPPKLARMMINLSQASRTSALLDPFVGSGTVLQEAALLGVTKLFGSDVREDAIHQTQKNLQWLEQEYHKKFEVTLSGHAIEMSDPKNYEQVTHIVGELDLGPPLRYRMRESEAQTQAKKTALLVRSLFELVRQLPRLNALVIALPYWPTSGQTVFVECKLPKGFSIQRHHLSYSDKFSQESSGRGGYLYRRDKQHVGREILHLVKQ